MNLNALNGSYIAFKIDIGRVISPDRPCIYMTYPNTFDKFAVCVHEIFHYVRKHTAIKPLLAEYEAERMTRTYLNKLILLRKPYIYIDLYDLSIKNNLKKYLPSNNTRTVYMLMNL